MNDTIAEIDKRLTALDTEIDTKTSQLRTTALKAVFDKSTAAARAKTKQELVALTVDRDDLQAARAQALQIDEDDQNAAEAAREYAQREAAAAKRRESNARVYQAAEAMENAVQAFLTAARALHAERTLVSSETNDHLSMAPRRVIKGIVDKLRAEGHNFNAFNLQDGLDHWSVGIGAIGLLKKQVAP